MASTGPTAGRFGEVLISNAASSDVSTATYVAVERVNNPGFTGELKKADSSSNDSGGNEEHVVTWAAGKFTFEMVADGAVGTAGQAHCWTSWSSKEIRAIEFQPTAVAGDRKYRFLASIDSIEDAAPKDGARAFKVTMTRTGSITIATV